MSDVPTLPDEFQFLQGLADKFAISDDVERGAKMEAATLEEKQDLVDAVSPHFDAINAYLDDHDDSSAHLLGRLAEATAEARIELARKRPS